MSDEFNLEGRSFEAGEYHLWTALDKNDGVNAALKIYATNMTTTECCDEDNCYFYIETDIAETNITVWNDYISPPGYEEVSFYYRSAMVQGWNKFCIQGELAVVRAQLPGAVSNASGNPDVANLSMTARASSIDYYPMWPGTWMLGDLGRAIFTGSTARMWPFSYNECNEAIFNSQNQRMNAYTGAYLSNAENTDPECTESGGSTSTASTFTYQMDALSSNWGIHMAGYLDLVTYSVEWNAAQMNPRKVMVEKPMYFIFNVAMSSSWGAKPPNAGTLGCYGDGIDAICDALPMKMKVDYIRVYQDTSSMVYGCDPSSHPTKQKSTLTYTRMTTMYR
ncbi:hypothetical protein F443_07168 [Phytophthora nicotianae P1569]|uniref:GH16 domain-containing protein n=1 Tax=Phytophthora nicotianae P1569 TaxID=1317065 RepID=V9FBN8_PHYNI|nr:hypothetical protein F443_07168 [Phytophthora nicotianae P1569]